MAQDELLVRVLEAAVQAGQEPFFPGAFATATGLPRADIDAAVDRLRINGYLHIADWVHGKGQRYAATPAGIEALEHRSDLRKPAAPPEPEQPTVEDRTWQRGETMRRALVEPAAPLVTRALLFANLSVFAIGLFVGVLRGVAPSEYLFGELFTSQSRAYGQLLDSLGSVSASRVIADNEWWRLVTYQFLHSGLGHLGMNMLGLFLIGPLLEAMWGSKRFLYVYLASGVFAGAVIVVVSRAGAVGASGALSGMLTSLAVCLWVNRDSLPEQFTSRLGAIVGINLIFLVYGSFQTNVSWEGHLGGAVGGALVSVPLQFERFGHSWRRLLGWLGLIAVPVAPVGLAYFVQSGHRADYAAERRIQEYDQQFRGAESYLLQRRNRFLVPVLRDGEGNWTNDAKFVADAQKACEQSLTRLEPLFADLVALKPRSQQETEEANRIHLYFAAWNELLKAAQRYLAEPQRWNPARRDKLRELDHVLWELRLPLEANTALPRFSPLVADEEKQPAPKPPAKDVG